jgi:oligopeptide transport system ATP-binding protein
VDRLLEVEDLRVTFEVGPARYKAVDGISFAIDDGEAVGLVGESGSGKSVTARSILGLTEPRHLTGGAIRFRGTDLVSRGDAAWRQLRGCEIALIPQNALAALNPLFTVGWQIGELFRVHDGASRSEARRRGVALMEQVGIPAAAKRFDSYPHEFSGGMRQRAVIAMAVALNPKLVIADEPTTALDVTMEAQVMDLLAELRRETRMALVHITHDVELVASSVDRMIVMYAGRIVEEGPAEDLYHNPAHPYTRALLESRPSLGDRKRGLLPTIPGAPPKISAIPSGCAFHPRCAHMRERCAGERPVLRPVTTARAAACHYAEEVIRLGNVRESVSLAGSGSTGDRGA